MKTLHPSSQYKRDIKKYRNNTPKIVKLMELLRILEKGNEIPKEFKPHALTGDYTGCIECHIGSDFLLIWFAPDSDDIYLLRLGSHSELFSNGRKR